MWPFDQNNQQVYQQYAQGYDNGNYDNFNQNQAFGHLQQFMMGAPQDLQQQVYQQHFEQMPYEQRALLAQQMPAHYGVDPNNSWSLSQGLMRLGQESPQLLQRIFSHPLLLGSAMALTGLVAKHMLSRHHNGGFGGQNVGYAQGGYNPQAQYMQQELYQERREDQELRRELAEERREDQELRRELRREEQMEEREFRHHRRDDY
ncbi:MAG TPA: hypothetical protein VKX46_18550 [Ktedonobacteraceae bacterium]|nr:hypothetical protein [Ktedonobacteraceae bacterium]